jgi:hypothetical protein
MQGVCKAFTLYFCGMAGKTDTRVPRSFTFSFDEDGDKARYHLLAKAESRSLASLIKHLLEQHAKQQGAKPQ